MPPTNCNWLMCNQKNIEISLFRYYLFVSYLLTFQLQVPALLEPSEQHPLLSVTVTYKDVIQGKQDSQTHICSIPRPVVAQNQTVNKAVDIQRNVSLLGLTTSQPYLASSGSRSNGGCNSSRKRRSPSSW